MSTPPVTVGLPIYNAERFLAEAIRSIQAQTFEDYQVIPELDAPTDRSEQILRDLADERFAISKNDVNLGLCATSNILIAKTNSELLARMDADDTIAPDRLKLQYAFMFENPDVDVLGTYFDLIDENGVKIEDGPLYPTHHEGIREAYRRIGVLCGATSMFRVEKIRAVGGYEYRYAEDYALWLKCLANGYRFANLPLVLMQYRQHRAQIMSRLREPTLRAIDRAYAMYGRAIWGDDAPNYVSGLNPLHRLWRRFKRVLDDSYLSPQN